MKYFTFRENSYDQKHKHKNIKVALFGLVLLLLTGCTPKTGEVSTISDVSDTQSNPIEIIDKEGYVMKISSDEKGKVFEVTTEKAGGSETPGLPYENLFPEQTITLNVDENGKLDYIPTLSYNKREGGSYIYSNNPEVLAKEDVGNAIIRNRNMSGKYEFTFEHSNRSGAPIYLGYQLSNEGSTDATVTVYNIGLQVEGEWLGQRSWSDFFNYRFELPNDYFLEDGKTVNPVYIGCDYVDYTPGFFEPVTLTIPAGEYIYVLGGTTADAYGNANVGDTADKPVLNGKCSNGVVLFEVSGGDVTGSFYAYDDASQVQANPKEQGYIVERNGTDYGAQYKGTDPHLGLIEANITFVVNDKTEAGKLPVLYYNMRDPDYASKTEPFQEYSLQENRVVTTEWINALNPNTTPKAIGTDMMTFEYIDVDGNPIIIDNNRADGRGLAANTGNWMVQYSDNFTLVNTGTEARTFKIYKKGAAAGVLITMVRDENGKALDAQFKAQPYYYAEGQIPYYVDKSLLTLKNGYYWYVVDGKPFCDVMDERALTWSVTVEPMSIERITVDYLILGNSNGGVTHWVEVE